MAERRRRGRNSAAAGLLVAFLLTAAIVALALAPPRGLAVPRPDASTAWETVLAEASGPGDGGGTGSGSGGGAGPGTGEGTGTASNDAGSVADASSQPNTPSAAEVRVEQPAEPPSPVTTPQVTEPPAFGFTAPKEPAEETPGPKAPGVPGATAPGGGGGGAEFMGVRSEGRHIVYVIDRSASMMGDRFLHMLLELKRSIERLPEASTFSVVFFSSGTAFTGSASYTVMPPGRLMRANRRNKLDAIGWLDTITPVGGTDPTDALAAALGLRPDAVFLMTDGMFDDPSAVESLLAARNPGAKVSVNTIAFHERLAEGILKRIAAAHRGDYKFVPNPSNP